MSPEQSRWDLPASYPADPEPRSDPVSWITATDYPPAALAARREGDATFEVVVAPTGAVRECWIVATSGSRDLDQATCQIVQARAWFRPAYDPDGTPVYGRYRQEVSWRLGGSPALGPHSAQFAFVVEPDGSVRHCRVVSMSGEVPTGLMAGNPCTVSRYEPYLDESGNPVRKNVTMTFRVDVRDDAGD